MLWYSLEGPRFLHENMLWYSLEAPRRGASNEYPHHMFSWRNKKDISIFRMKKMPYLLLWTKEEWRSAQNSCMWSKVWLLICLRRAKDPKQFQADSEESDQPARMNAQADLSLRWTHMQFCRKGSAPAQFLTPLSFDILHNFVCYLVSYDKHPLT